MSGRIDETGKSPSPGAALEFRICAEPIDAAQLQQALNADAAGACVCFEGWVRDHNEGRAVTALEYEAHEALAEKLGQRIVAAAQQRFDVLAVRCWHRIGQLQIGDCAVWVGVSAAHRGAAFDACRYVIDQIKHEVPIWKKERYLTGESAWVNCATGAPRGPDAESGS
jgi:molybdopterin synthase catalytic subunit